MSQDDERASASVSRPVVLPEKFSGANDFSEWISHFEGIAAINKWTEEEKKLWLGVRLAEKAHVAFTRLPTEAHQSYVRTSPMCAPVLCAHQSYVRTSPMCAPVLCAHQSYVRTSPM